jgi:photosystem II stability/assembly factor-like uncharacterized protein
MKNRFIPILMLTFSTLIFPQWQMLNGPFETQKVKFLYNHPNGTLFSIGFDNYYDNNIIYRSTNFGQTWEKVLVAPNYNEFYCVSGNSTNAVYVGGDYGIYFSVNNGDTWTLMQDSHVCYDIVINSIGEIYISDNAVWKSTNGGTSWTLVLNRTTWDLLLINDDLYASNMGGISYSSDHGATWEFRSDGLPPEALINLVKNNEGVFFIATSYEIYKSIDLGLHWTQTSDSIGSSFFTNLTIGNNDHIYATDWNDGVYKSTNSGNDWHLLPLPSDLNDCAVADNKNNLFAGTNRGLYKYSEPDSTWYLGTLYKDLGNINSFAFCSDNTIYASTSMRLWKSNDLGLTWNNINDQNTPGVDKGLNDRIFISSPLLYSDNCNDNWVSSNINSFDKIYVASDGNLYAGSGIDIFKSSDNGESWNFLGNSSVFGVDRFNDIKVNSSGKIFITQYGRYWDVDWHEAYRTRRSNDNGSTFQSIYSSKVVYAIAIDKDENVYLATRGGGVLKSDSSTTLWTAINSGLLNFNVNDLIFSPEGILIAATDNGVFRYWEDLDYWSPLNSVGLSSTKIKSLHYHNDLLYAGTSVGLAYFVGELPVEITLFSGSLTNQIVTLNWTTASETNNSGFEIQRKFKNNNWTTIGFVKGNGTTTNQIDYTFSENLSDFSLSGVVAYRLKQIDYNGTFSYSNIVEIDLPEIDFVLFQNYPNPFNPNTKIKFSIPTKSKVKFQITDMLGNVIITLINNQEMNPGNYVYDFDGSDLASGIYFYSLKTSEFYQTKKMILLK